LLLPFPHVESLGKSAWMKAMEAVRSPQGLIDAKGLGKANH
jgi:hypothetical protein